MMDKIIEIVYQFGIAAAFTIVFLALSFGLSGCASSDGYQRYLSAQSAAIKSQKPMLRITAEKGQAITGLASIEVYGPGMSIQQEKDNEWARVISGGIQTIGVVGGIAAAGQASRQLVEAVGGLGISSSVVNTDNRTVDTHAITDSYNATATPTVVTSPAPVVVNQPAPVVVTQPTPIVVQPQVIIP
jgi:hypothetical protein